MRYEAVIFDLDDTLLDTLSARVAALQETFMGAGVKHPTAESFFHGWRGVEFREALRRDETTKDLSTSLFESYRHKYWTGSTRQVRLYFGIEDLLRRLHTSGVKLAVFTQKGRRFEIDGIAAGAAVELDRVGVLNLFSAIVGMEDVRRAKPDPEGILILVDRLGVPCERTLMVGDSWADMEAARAACCTGCHATWGIPAGSQLAADAATFAVSSPASLGSLILEA